jgi:Las1-like
MSTKRQLQPSILRHNKRIRSTAQQSPAACNWKELNAIGKALLLVSKSYGLGDDAKSMTTEDALERIAVWKIRSPKISHAIEATAALAQILLREKTDDRMTTTMELRLAYSCAILRAINGLADTLQQQRPMASSVAVLCSELGVPAWLVAIRHEATHNQLPPLPTLRMAANALMQYFQTVYWEPISQSRIDAYDEAMALLREYEAAAIEAEQAKDRKTNIDRDEEINVEESISSSSEEEEARMMNGLWQPTPGTTSNRFALLLDDKKRTKAAPDPQTKKKQQAAATKKKPARTTRGPDKPTSSACAHKYVKAKISIDIAQSAVLDFLVWGSSEKERGVLVDGDFASLLIRYHPLLSTLGRTWPGFLGALLVACVDQLLSIESSSSTESTSTTSDAHCQTLELWVRFLLSKKFLGQFDDAAKAECKVNEKLVDIAPLSVLKTHQFPLNRLCDRCSAVSDDTTTSEPRSACNRLGELLTEILGAERSANYGVDLAPTDSSEPKPTARAVDRPRNSTKIPAAPLSLDAMEALLSGDGTAVATLVPKAGSDKIYVTASTGDPSDPDQIAAAKPCPTGWVRCTSWEPCAIGKLP